MMIGGRLELLVGGGELVVVVGRVVGVDAVGCPRIGGHVGSPEGSGMGMDPKGLGKVGDEFVAVPEGGVDVVPVGWVVVVPVGWVVPVGRVGVVL
jgi:hypothetical protein